MATSRSRSAISGAVVRREAVAVSLNILSTVLAIVFMFPFVWAVSSSLKEPIELVIFPPKLFPAVPQWGNYKEAWTVVELGQFFENSAFVTILSIIGTITSSFLVAYGFARFRFPGREALFLLCLSGMMMPVYVTIIPLFDLFRALRWIDTYKPLIVPSYFGSAFAIFLLRQFIMTIPFDLDESALIDGASRLKILTKIILPNCKPVLAAVAIFVFRGSWNRFLGPLIFIDTVKKFTLPLGLWFLRGYADEPGLPKEHLLMAGAFITSLPVMIVFAAAQRYFIQGIVTTGLKG